MSRFREHSWHPLLAVSVVLTAFLVGCAPSYVPPATSQAVSQSPSAPEAPTTFQAGGEEFPSCLRLLEDQIRYINLWTDAKNRSTKFIQEHNAESPEYEAQVVDLSKILVTKIQNTLTYCKDKVDIDSELSELSSFLVDAGRPEDGLRVASECHREFTKSPYCMASSAQAFYKLGRNAEARAAANRVIQRGPYDAKMEATIELMRSLITLINSDEKLRALKKEERALDEQAHSTQRSGIETQ